MKIFSKTIPDLGNGLSGLKGVFDKISEQTGFALYPREYEGIILPGDYRHFSDKRGIIDFEWHFLVVIT